MNNLKSTIIITTTTITFAIGSQGLAFAQSSGQPDELQAIYACKTITEADKRLACYDNSVGRFKAAEKSGKVIAVSKTAIEKVEREAFGFNIPSLPSISGIFGKKTKNSNSPRKTDESNELSSAEIQAESIPKPTKPAKIRQRPEQSDVSEVILNIRKTTKFGRNKTRFFMSNGQVWEQVEAIQIKIPKKKTDKEYTAEISKAALGSFIMRVNGKGSAIRVKRVR